MSAAEESGSAPEHPVLPDPVLSYPVLGGAPSDLELAAIVAVLDAQLQEAATDARRPAARHPSAWSRSRTTLRPPLSPGIGAWRTVGG